jgi:hypothetical protein
VELLGLLVGRSEAYSSATRTGLRIKVTWFLAAYVRYVKREVGKRLSVSLLSSVLWTANKPQVQVTSQISKGEMSSTLNPLFRLFLGLPSFLRECRTTFFLGGLEGDMPLPAPLQSKCWCLQEGLWLHLYQAPWCCSCCPSTESQEPVTGSHLSFVLNQGCQHSTRT